MKRFETQQRDGGVESDIEGNERQMDEISEKRHGFKALWDIALKAIILRIDESQVAVYDCL